MMKRNKSWWVMTSGLVVGLGLFVAAVVWARFGSMTAGLAYASGKQIYVWKSLGTFPETEKPEAIVKFTIQNLRSGPVTIIGANSSCTCTAASGLPLLIPGKSSRVLDVTVRYRAGTEPETNQSINLYTDNTTQPVVPLKVIGRFLVKPAVATTSAARPAR